MSRTTSGQHAVGTSRSAAEPARTSLTDAVEGAVQSGTDELARLEGLVAEAESRLRNAWQVLSSGRRDESRDDDGFFALLDGVVGDLKDRLSESHRVSSTFNIVFFGRTGAGKSTLLSALGGLNGELVSSDGRSDFTTDVRALDWHGCRLYDTPGINGWGRTRSRPDLEKSAREAVQVADVVLLCFDSQGPQASEFGKVAEWVRAYGKPAIAVLNMRNIMWRHPARVSTAAQRKGLSQTAQQHADTIASELDAIGLPGVPIVAIHSKRGLFARASVPFVGPAAGELEHERAVHGLEYLDRWSNLPVLEQLISACILEGAGDLKLAALREGFQVRLRELADEVDLVADEQQQRGAVIERTISAWLDNLGYPKPAAEGTDLLRQLEAARGEPYTAPVLGRLQGHVRHLLRSHLYLHRTKSLRAAETLILDAFGDERVAADSEFEERVFDSKALNKSLVAVARQAGVFLLANLGLAGTDARIELELIDRLAPSIRGNAGRGHRWGANVLRALGLFGSAASAALGLLALTNFWNPAGWVAGVIVVGGGAVSAILNFFGRRTRKGAEKRRVAARAHAVAEARATVNSYYDECEAQQLSTILARSWESATPRLDGLLEDALRTRVGCATVTSEAGWLRNQADDQPPSPSSSDVLRLAAQRVYAQASGWNPPNLDAVLLGEDWILSTAEEEASDLSESDRLGHVKAADKDRSAFTAYLGQGHLPRDPERIGRWLTRASRAKLLDQRAREELEAARTLLQTPPNVVVLGDYSSGKTSLIKRLLTETGAETPTGMSVAAGRATNAVGRYSYGSLVLIDAPGFQSGQDDHDAVALNAAQDAAIVIVVLHVNLLIGDTSLLERLLLGDEVRVGKAPRTVFVIGRIDEVGADPQSAAREFLGRRQRKVEELLSMLESRGLVVEPSRVLPLSADPYALVGDRTPVVSADYAATNRIWDGISSLSEPLLALEGDLLVRHSAGAALDRGRSALLSVRSRLVLDRADIQDAQAASDRLEQLMETSLAELRLLMQSIERRIGRAVDDHANEVLAEALGSGPAEVAPMSKRLRTWWNDPRLDSAIQALQGSVDRDLTDWWTRHASELDRELRRVEFAMNRDELPKPGNGAGDAVGAGMGVAGGIVRGAHGIGKALGNRDAVYAIGKALGAKFKPWGAVKLGAKVGKAAAVLGVVAVAFDIVEFVNDNIQQEKREQAREVAVEHVRATVPTVISDLLTQVGGPIEYGKQSEKDIIDQLTQLREESELQHQSALEISQGLEEIILLQGAGTVLSDPNIERVMT